LFSLCTAVRRSPPYPFRLFALQTHLPLSSAFPHLHVLSYITDVQLAGGTPRFVPLRPPQDRTPTSASHYKLDLDELERAINPATKVMLINNPQNVPGKVYTREELEGIARIAIKHDLLVLSDEVYEGMVYDGCEHVRMADTIDGMWERTLTLGSAGKTFSLTGFKVGSSLFYLLACAI
jgi:kynurenine aminotransferase